MNKTFVRVALLLLAILAVGYPLSVWYQGATLALDLNVLRELFPAFGLLAVTIMYLHIIGRPFKTSLEPYVSFDRFERISSYLVLVSIILHPLLRTVFLLIQGISLIPPPAYVLPITLGALGFLMLVTYDLGKLFVRSPFIERHWNKIDVISTLGFYVVWTHALLLGSDLQIGPLRTLWLVYGLTAASASLLVLGRYLEKRSK